MGKIARRLSGSRLVVSFAVLLLMGLGSARRGEAQSAGGSLSISPDLSILSVGDTVHEVIQVTNASFDKSPGFGDIPATLTGTTLLTLACADSACSTPLPGTLTFSGCSNKATGICCDVDLFDDFTGNTVFITMPGSTEPDGITVCPGTGGLIIPAGGSVQLASVNSSATSPVFGDGTFFSVGATGPNDLTACSLITPADCATGGGAGEAPHCPPGAHPDADGHTDRHPH